MRYKQSCSSLDTISKDTVLAMIQAPSVLGIKPGELIEYIDDRGRTTQNRVLKVGRDTVTLEGINGAFEVDKTKVKKNDASVFLDKLTSDQWSITSFDPKTRVVCITFTTPAGVRNMTVTLPIIEAGHSI